MLRIVLIQALLFATPFIIYGTYLYVTHKTLNAPEKWRPRIFILIISGLLIAIAGFILMALFTGEPPDAEYRPAELRDGEIVPGTIE